MNIYIGNLAKDVSEDEIRRLFGEYGKIDSVKIIMDRFTGQPRGYGFVEMPDNKEAETAIEELDGKELNGQSLKVNMAKSRAERRGHPREQDAGRPGGGYGGGKFGGASGFGGKPGGRRGKRGDR